MPTPTKVTNPKEYLVALGPIMTAGTQVDPASVFMQKGLRAESAPTFPVLVLNCPHTTRTYVGVHSRQPVFHIEGLIMDRWETSGRDFEDILDDMQDMADTMMTNIEGNETLGLGATLAAEDIEIFVDGPVEDAILGHPVVVGLLLFKVKGPWYTVP